MVTLPLCTCTFDALYAAPAYGPVIEQENNGYFVHRVEYRLYLNSTQMKMLEHHLGLCHRLYNMMLEASLSDLANGFPKKSVFGFDRRGNKISDADLGVNGELYSTYRYDISFKIHQVIEEYTYDSEIREYRHKPKFRSERKYGSLTYNIPQGFGFAGPHQNREDHVSQPSSPEGRLNAYLHNHEEDRQLVRQHRLSYSKSLHEEDLENLFRPETYDLWLMNLITNTSEEKVKVSNFYVTKEKEIGRI